MEDSLTFIGGADTVTGSQTLLKWGRSKILVDCGLFQGPPEIRQRNWRPTLEGIKEIDAIVLTHAHLDHSGYLARAVHCGFRGPIYSSFGTMELTRLILKDAAYLEEEQARHANATKYSHHNPALPLFTGDDVQQVMSQFHVKDRNDWHSLAPDLSFKMLRAGHIIGANIVQFHCQQGNKSLIITFSGDLGHDHSFTMKGPARVHETDVLVLESTYGDRLHPRTHVLDSLAGILKEVWQNQGCLIIPSFAVGRAQDLIYLFRLLENEKRLPPMPIYLDSPMASEATQIFIHHPEDQKIDVKFLDDKAGLFPSRFHATKSPQESQALCARKDPMIVISSSGMLSGGRILHHLKARIADPRNTILFTGYQAEGTKGRYLQNLEPGGSLRIHHQEFPVKAKIATLDELSAHGDYGDMIDWCRNLYKAPQKVVLNHGSPTSQMGLAGHLQETLGWPSQQAAIKKTLHLKELLH